MDILSTKNNSFDSDYLATIPYPPRAYIRVCNSDFATVAAIFSNPAETSRIECGDVVLSGFTRLVAISAEDNAIKVCLAKETI